jgi:L-lysine exporter family protein LysE/ArgO
MNPAFLHGFILAFSLIIPLGIQNVFIFSQGATQKNFFRVLPVVVVAGLCDTLLILLAVFGVSLLVLSVSWIEHGLMITGMIFLIYIGWLTWRAGSETGPRTDNTADWSLQRRILFTLSVSLLNPHAILDTIGVIGTSSLSYPGQDKMVFAAACVLVSWIWFFFLATAGRILGSLLPFEFLHKNLNRVSAIIIWICAVYLGIKLF